MFEMVTRKNGTDEMITILCIDFNSIEFNLH